MKQEDLESLILDRHLGELPEEVSALLDAYLERVPNSTQITTSLEEASHLASELITRDSSLVALGDESLANNLSVTEVRPAQLARWLPVLSGLCAVVLALFFGFQWGLRTSGPRMEASQSQEVSPPASVSPWARYNLGDLARQPTQATALPFLNERDIPSEK